MIKATTVTKTGLNLSDWDICKKQISQVDPNITFGEYLKNTEPNEWELGINMAIKIIQKGFMFILDWKLEDSDIFNHAVLLISGGFILEHQYDYRIAGIFVYNALRIMSGDKSAIVETA